MQVGLKISIMCKHIDLHTSFAYSITIYKLFFKPTPQNKTTATNEQPFTLNLSPSGYSHGNYFLPVKEQKKAGRGLLSIKQTGPEIEQKNAVCFVFYSILINMAHDVSL